MYEMTLILSVAVFAWVVSIYAKHPAASVFHPGTFYLAFHGLLFVIRPIFGYIYDYQAIYRAIGFQPSLEDKVTVMMGASLGLVVFMAVALHVAKEPLRFKQGLADNLHRRALATPFWLPFFALGSLGLAALAFSWNLKTAGISVNVTNMETGVATMEATSGYFYQAVGLLVPLVALLVWFNRYKTWTLAVFAAYVLVKGGTGGRGDFINASVMLSLFYLYDSKAYWPKAKVLAFGIAMVVFFNFVVADRGKAIRSVFEEEQAAEYYYDTATLQPLEHMDLGNMEFFEFIVYAVPQRTGSYDYFLNNLQLFTEPIPRQLWEGKPQGPPIRLFQLYDHGTPIGMTFSVPGAGWYSLGYVGIVIWCGLFALFYATLYKRFAEGEQNNLQVATYVIMLTTTILAFRDGSAVTIAKQVLSYLLPVLVLSFMAKGMGTPTRDEILLRLQQMKLGKVARRSAEDDTVGAVLVPRSQRKMVAAVDAPRSVRRRSGRASGPETAGT